MRILFISNLYPPNVVGGYERLCFEVAAALAARGHDVSVLTSDYGGRVADYPNQKIDRSLSLLTGSTVYQPFSGTIVEREQANRYNVERLHDVYSAVRPDLVYSWNLFFFDRSLLEALAELNVPTVVMLTDNWLVNMLFPEYVASFFRNHVFGNESFPPARAPQSWLGRLFRRNSDSPTRGPMRRIGVTAVFGSTFMRDFYTEAGLYFEAGVVIHNGVVQDQYATANFRNRSESAAEHEFRILFAGRLVDLKGADTVVSALDYLSRSHLNEERVQLTIIGDDQDVQYVEHLDKLIGSYAGDVVIERRPTVAEAALFNLFQEHDVYVFPSLYEPFSLTLIHALAAGIPTIASDAGGNVEIIKDGFSGLTYPKGNAAALADRIQRLRSSPILRENLSHGGRAAAKAFTFDKLIERTESFFNELL